MKGRRRRRSRPLQLRCLGHLALWMCAVHCLLELLCCWRMTGHTDDCATVMQDGAGEDVVSVAASEEVDDAASSAAPAGAAEAGSVQDSASRGAPVAGGSEDASTVGRDVPEERDKVPLSLAPPRQC